jgi:hypothetical protein
MIPIGKVIPQAIVMEPAVFEDLRIGASATGVGAANFPTFQKNFDNGAGSVGLFQRTFSATARNDVFFEAQISHAYREGSDMLCHVHYIPLTNNVGNIIWELEYSFKNINAAFGNTTLVTPITQGTSGVAGVHTVTALATISGGALTVTPVLISAFVIGRLSRLGNDGGDTYTGECAFLGIDFHLQQNTLGSELEFIKFR